MRNNRSLFAKTALNMVLALAFPTIYNPAKTDVQFQKLITKASSAVSNLREALYGIAVAKDDLEKVQTGITLTFHRHNDGKTKSFRELMAMHTVRMLAAILEALEANNSMNSKLRVETSYV